MNLHSLDHGHLYYLWGSNMYKSKNNIKNLQKMENSKKNRISKEKKRLNLDMYRVCHVYWNALLVSKNRKEFQDIRRTL